MKPKKRSQQNLLEHSQIKVNLLKKYVEAYLGILCNTSWIEDVYIFDLFAGPGIYEDGGIGSPVILLQSIAKANKTIAIPRNKRTTFHCLFNDNNPKISEKLKETIYNLDINIDECCEVEYTSKDFKDILPQILDKIRTFNNERGFVFLDPYGYKDIQVDDIISILKSKKCEVLLFLPTQFMYRFKDKGTPSILRKLIDEIGLTSKLESKKGLDFIEDLTDGFQERLGQGIYVDSFAIGRDINQYFSLFFFTSNKLGYLKMLEAKWDLDRAEGRGWEAGKKNDLFSDIEPSPKNFKLRELLIEYLQNGSKTNGEIFDFALKHRFLPKHAKEILQNFQQENRLEVTDQSGELSRKGAFYLTPNALKENPSKINIKLK